MSDIFGSGDSVFFVGGQGTKTGTTNPGGCSRTWWETAIGGGTKAEIQAAMNKIMQANGEAKWNLSNCAFDYSNYQFTVPDTTGVEVGMVAYVSGTDIIAGRYEITAVPDSTHIEVSGIIAFDDNEDSTIVIGGAFADFSDAVASGVLNALSYDVCLYINKSQTRTSVTSITTGGSYGIGSKFQVRGYNEVPGDMDMYGEYYQSPMDAYLNGIDANAFVKLENTVSYCVSITNKHNIHFANIHFDGTSYGVYASNSATYRGGVLEHCVLKSTGGFTEKAVNFYMLTQVSIFDCFFDGSNGVWADQFIRISKGNDNVIYNNVFVGQTGRDMLCCDGGFVFNNLFIDNRKAILFGTSSSVATCVALNNTSYKNTGAVFYNGWVDATVNYSQTHILNNLFLPENDRTSWSKSGIGGVAVNIANNCSYYPGGYTGTNPWTGTAASSMHSHKNNIEVDPDCIDLANGDYRTKNANVSKGGLKDLGGIKGTHIGAFLPDSTGGGYSGVFNQG